MGAQELAVGGAAAFAIIYLIRQTITSAKTGKCPGCTNCTCGENHSCCSGGDAAKMDTH